MNRCVEKGAKALKREVLRDERVYARQRAKEQDDI